MFITTKEMFLALVLFSCFGYSTAFGQNITNQKAVYSAAIRVGVFNGNGASPENVTETVESLKIDGEIIASLLSARDIVLNKLDSLDVVLFPGGSGSQQYNSLGSGLREKIRQFVLSEGKGIVGICAGAYLISDTWYYPCLNLIEAHAVDRQHDARGGAVAEIKLTKEGFAVFPELKGFEYTYIQYHDGPLFVPSQNAKKPTYINLAVFISDIHLTGNAPAGMTPGKPFLLNQELGKGRVFACAGHPEGTRGMRWIVPRMVRWVAKRELISYPEEVVRPVVQTREIFHHDTLEKAMYWQLFDKDPDKRIRALKTLADLQYRNGIRWAVGMLRDESPPVRGYAADVLVENEYTAAIPEIQAALRFEKNKSITEKLENALMLLSRISHNGN